MNARMAVMVSLATGLLGASPEISITFAGHLAINDWRADKSQGMWIQDEHLQWYYARFRDPCQGLAHADTIAFDTRPGGPFDRFSSIIVPHEFPCHLQSLVRSDPPPKKAKSAAPRENP
jgi:hypothetical protein